MVLNALSLRIFWLHLKPVLPTCHFYSDACGIRCTLFRTTIYFHLHRYCGHIYSVFKKQSLSFPSWCQWPCSKCILRVSRGKKINLLFTWSLRSFLTFEPVNVWLTKHEWLTLVGLWQKAPIPCISPCLSCHFGALLPLLVPYPIVSQPTGRGKEVGRE